MASRLGPGGWLKGKTVRKGGALSSNNTRSSTPQGVQSTSTTIFGGGVKDASGRTSEFFVSWSLNVNLVSHKFHSLWMTNVLSARVIDI